jgi:hypothetical protein
MTDIDPLAAMQSENARLIALLENHRIAWRLNTEPAQATDTAPIVNLEPSRLSTSEKVTLFRRLFRDRTDAYPLRWESKTTGKSCYAPAYSNEWFSSQQAYRLRMLCSKEDSVISLRNS